MTVLITGAGGHLGRAVARRVLEALAVPSGHADPVDPAARVLLATRNPAALRDEFAGVEVRRADFDRPGDLPAAFAGATTMLLVSTDSVSSRAAQQAAAVDAARAAGVRHVIYTSMISPQPGNPALIADSHWATEEYVRGSGLDFTILRCGLYADFQAFEAVQALAGGRLVHNRGGGRCAYIAREDCARAAAAVLTGSGHDGQVYELTGPDALGAVELAELYARCAGAPVAAQSVSDAELLRLLDDGATDGHAQYGAALAVSLGRATREGRFESVTDDVERLTGAAPRSVESLLSDHRDLLRAAVTV